MEREKIFKEMLEEIWKIIERYEKKLKDYYPYETLKNNVKTTLKTLSL